MSFFERRIHLITGKGGVGRTTVAVALARASASLRKRVLLTEIGDPEGGYSAIARRFGHETLTHEPQELSPGLLACHLWAPTGHEEFFRSVLPARALIRAALRSRALSRFLLAAPSFHEMGIFYHLLTLLEAREPNGSPTHEVVIVDMPATGHTRALTELPDILLRLVPSGPVADVIRRGQSYLNDPDKSAAWIVTLPEQLPVTEALELYEALEISRMPVGGLILNRLPEDPFGPEEHAALTAWMAHTPTHGEMAWRRIGSSAREARRLADSSPLTIWDLPELGEEVQGHLERSLGDVLRHRLEASV